MSQVLRRDTAGPFWGVFRNHLWLYRLGFDVQLELEMTASGQGWREWQMIRKRPRWHGVPLFFWRPI